MLDDQQQAQLVQALEGEHPGGGRWTGPKVAMWMSELLVQWHRSEDGKIESGLLYSIKVPRPEHREADELEQQEWKKKLRERKEAFFTELGKLVRLWTMDEQRARA